MKKKAKNVGFKDYFSRNQHAKLEADHSSKVLFIKITFFCFTNFREGCGTWCCAPFYQSKESFSCEQSLYLKFYIFILFLAEKVDTFLFDFLDMVIRQKRGAEFRHLTRNVSKIPRYVGNKVSQHNDPSSYNVGYRVKVIKNIFRLLKRNLHLNTN